MSDAENTTDATAGLAAKLDHLTSQVDEIAAELQRQRRSREMWADLNETITPITHQAMDVATEQLEDLSDELSVEDLTRFARTAAVSIPKLEVMLAQVGPLLELAQELSTLTEPAMEKLTEVLLVAEDKGYLAFAQTGGAIADQAVVAFTDPSMDAKPPGLLSLAKQMKDPEIRRGLARLLAVLKAVGEPTNPPAGNSTQ